MKAGSVLERLGAEKERTYKLPVSGIKNGISF